MSVRCQVTGKKPGYGNQVSHSHHKTRRRWLPNVQNKRYWLPAENRWIRLRVSTKGMKTIEKRGIDAVVADMRARGERI
ncbi:50S ribosomal protein L28 [Saccharopolyspora mangrovi]|uniref:Large ribosomal subunit protein bL28 n=1 Tax=Saccharopolyspora mangrovi TaxID=3082379 RepID=A0ABU6A3X6_9PSEU|nr:50S ribosomal protein L28 [Saccharopolyspora sp. S2-29]MEB3366181.1 50S ribosomal protein L28 [Saccharopolyspora sp. S2-29]